MENCRFTKFGHVFLSDFLKSVRKYKIFGWVTPFRIWKTTQADYRIYSRQQNFQCENKKKKRRRKKQKKSNEVEQRLL